jgi:hypothetical protein
MVSPSVMLLAASMTAKRHCYHSAICSVTAIGIYSKSAVSMVAMKRPNQAIEHARNLHTGLFRQQLNRRTRQCFSSILAFAELAFLKHLWLALPKLPTRTAPTMALRNHQLQQKQTRNPHCASRDVCIGTGHTTNSYLCAVAESSSPEQPSLGQREYPVSMCVS